MILTRPPILGSLWFGHHLLKLMQVQCLSLHLATIKSSSSRDFRGRKEACVMLTSEAWGNNKVTVQASSCGSESLWEITIQAWSFLACHCSNCTTWHHDKRDGGFIWMWGSMGVAIDDHGRIQGRPARAWKKPLAPLKQPPNNTIDESLDDKAV